MTNKINGIDVSECKHHYTNLVGGITYHACSIYEQTNELGYQQDTLCEQNPDCYFKQFKRLQEENKELKDRNANLRLNLATYDLPEIKKVLTDWRTGELDKKFKKLQKENEKLKEKIAKFRWDNPYYDLYNNVVGQRDNLKKENEKLKKLKCKFKEYCTCDIEKYRSALEEIRNEIGDLKNINRLINLQKILDIINEAFGNE